MAGSEASEMQPLVSEQPSRRSPNPPRESNGEVIYVLDDTDQQYVVPWEVGKDWASFDAFVREIFTRKKSEYLEEIVEGQFDASGTETKIIVLPSVWTSSIRPGDAFKITPWSLKNSRPIVIERPSSRGGNVRRSDFLDDEDIKSDGARTRVPIPGLETETEDDSVESDAVEDDAIESDSVDEETAHSKENDESDSGPAPPPERIRSVPLPIDDEGNELAFTVDTRCEIPPGKQGQEIWSNSDVFRKSPGRPTMITENYRITRAMSVVTEERTAIEIHTLSGPENSALPSNVFIRWNHLYAEYLDWMQFQSACLAVPDLSDRIQKLLKKLFMKIEEKGILKTYLNGMFVEPGTVLRADESDESSNQNDLQSVIFSCVPYFDISNTSDPPPGLVDLVYPARTLMEAYYPNKPVQDRDDEQAFRKFGNKRNAGLVHVPSLWMVNIGSQAVVTCGYRSLASEFQKSIIVVSDDIKQLSLGMKENKTTTIRLTDWDKRPLIYQRDECRTYFEMERKLRELRFSPGKDRNSLQLLTNTRNGLRKVTPAIWPSLVSQKNVIFVDVFVTNDPELNKIDKDLEVEDLQPPGLATVPPYSVPPFFHWPIASNEKNDAKSAMPADADRPMRCLTRVENDLIDLGVLESTTIGAVDETFTSSTYYEGLPEVKFADFVKSFISRPKSSNITNEHSLHAPFHKRYMEKYCSKFVKETAEFVDIVCETLGLFVSNMDNSILLRKLWGSMTNLVHVAERMAKMEPCEVDSQEYLDPNWRPRLSKDPSWWIRKGRASIPLPAPNGKKNFAATVKSCRKCKRYMFKSLDEALEHLRSAHLEENPPGRDSSSGQLHPNANETKELREWITNGDEWVIESTIYSATAVLSAATKKARHFLNLLHELSDGVRNEDGELSPLYALPGKLLDTFHQLVLLYFAVERSLHYIEEDTKVDKKSGMFAKGTDLEKLEKNSAILQRFSDDVRTPLVRAREDLCNMARSTTPTAVEERLSLGPEYICSWVMRKLIVKPLKNSMTIADMYNDYLLTIEFQVSHRPGKRLLRSIKLIQEEIKILQIVIAWQTRQITNYIKVLDYLTYPTSSALLPSRRVMFPLEYSLLASCLESLDMMRADLIDQYLRGDPLSDTAKQSAEINEEDHGKAIFVFTVVTAIFLPLSFITSYLGMNTADIRDMENNQTLFWEIAAPLTAVVMGAVVFVAYNGDELRDLFSSMYRTLTGKQPRDTLTRGISAAQRKRAAQAAILHSSTTLNTNKELAEKAEYGIPYPLRTESGFPYSQIKSSPPLAPNITLNNAYVRPPSPGFRHVAPPEPAVRNLRVRNSSYRRPTYENGLDYVDNSNDDYNRTHYKSRTKPIAMPPPLPQYRHQPTKIRMHRKYLSPETLAHFAVTYEPDPRDNDYVIVKQDLDELTLQRLHEHTQALQDRDRGYAPPPPPRPRSTGRVYEDPEFPSGPRNRGGRYRSERMRTRRGVENEDDEWYRYDDDIYEDGAPHRDRDGRNRSDRRGGSEVGYGRAMGYGIREDRLTRNNGRSGYVYVRKNTQGKGRRRRGEEENLEEKRVYK